jgi:protein ImuB
MRWLCLHFPWLALELHGIERSEPQALLDRRQRIELANPPAQQLGVTPGQALATALALSPQLRLLDTDAGQLQRTLEQLALWAGSFSARISLCPPQALLLEIASMLHYFGGLEALLTQVQAGLDSSGYSARLAVGETARGAQLLAAVENCLEADPQRWWAQLYRLPIDRLQLPARQSEQLHGVGLRTLGELLALPRAELARRFGQALIQTLDRIVAPGAAVPEPFAPPDRFVQRIDLTAEIVHAQGLLFPLRRLLAAQEGFLRQRQQTVSGIELLLHQRDGGCQQLRVGHAGGTAAASQWLELCRLQLEREPLQAPVLVLELRADEGQSQPMVNEDLFASTRARSSPEGLLSRLRSRLGEAAVSELQWREDHRPEQVLSGSPARSSRLPARYLRRPGWLLRQPQPLSAAQRRRLQWLAGPERICSGWWEVPIQRDYFIARWPDGRCGWLFRDDRGHWFLHGWFG